MKTILLAMALLLASAFAGADQQKPKMSPTDAEKTALSVAQGSVGYQETLTDPERYSFDIQTTPKEIHVVVVDAASGKVLSNATETPDELAKKKKKKTPSAVLKGNVKVSGNATVR